MMKKEIQLKSEDFGSEYAGKYVFETLAWGALNQITSDSTKLDPVSRKGSVDIKQLNAKILDATMTVRPPTITFDTLISSEGIPAPLGEFLMTIADEVNGGSKEEQERLKKLKQRCGLT